MTTDSTFDWPCDRRDAHHPHPSCSTCDSTGRLPYMVEMGLVDVEDDTVPCVDCNGEPGPCPGVGAHPSTMIGGAYHSERPT